MRNHFSIILVAALLFSSCKHKNCDLLIQNATILDVVKGTELTNHSIAIAEGRIIQISQSPLNYIADSIILAEGKLLTPSFIDTHIHPISEFADGNYDLVPDAFPEDSLTYYRQVLTDGYLPDGTTTALMMGHPDTWTDDFLSWSKNSLPDQLDVFTCGGALATEDGHTYPGHHRVLNPEVAKQKIIEYHFKGLNHLKLYWRLRPPEFQSIQNTADSLGMKMFAHSGGFFDPTQLNIFQAIDMGIRNFEHIAILPCSVFDHQDWEVIHEAYQNNFAGVEGDPNQLSLIYILETFKHAEENKKDEFLHLIDTMATTQCDISTTIGWVYKTYHETFFAPPKIKGLNEAQFERCHYNFSILMDYLNLIHQKNIPIRIGSDTNPGGKMVLLELMLMVEYGMSAEEAIKIATYNGARALGIEKDVGTIDVGKKANLILWNESPMTNFKNFTLGKSIIKDGIIYNPQH